MSNIGIYPGTFDPITYGHIDVVKRALKIVKKLVIAVSNDYSKEYMFQTRQNRWNSSYNFCLTQI